MTSIGLWIDDPVRRVLDKAYFDRLKAMRIQTVAIMLDSSRAGWNPKWKVEHLKELASLTNEYHTELIVTVWPDPVRRHLSAKEEGLRYYLSEVPAINGIEFDAEGNWTRKKVKGYRAQRIDGELRSAIDLAGDDLVAMAGRLKAEFLIRTELTTFSAHTENGRAADVAPHMDRLLPQAYSVHNRRRKGKEWKVPWHHSFGPGKMQRWTLDRADSVSGDQEIACGLAAYDQTWPGQEPEEAMRRAYEAAVEWGVEEIRYWSSKWVLGVRCNRYAERFLRDLAQSSG